MVAGAPGALPVLQLVTALILLLGGWFGLRWTAGARLRGAKLPLLVLDALPIVLLWTVLVVLTARPVVASALIAAAAYGLACGERAKRAATGEPLVFTDSVLGGIFLYPSLYAEFVTPPALLAAVLATLGLVYGAAAIEPPLFTGTWPVLVLVAVAGVALWAARRRRSGWLAAHIGATPLGDAKRDAAAFGPLAAIAIHSVVASRERDVRRRDRTPGCSDALPDVLPPKGPIVLLQLESFFDARRMGGFVPPGLLPSYDRCVAGAIRHGRLLTPAYGANTVRTEFAALTGLSDEAVGLDRFNPYAAFARVPIDSLAWRLKALGYRTICIHPFAGRFYGRHRVMPNLGFDAFVDIAGFDRPAAERGYVPDTAVVDQIARILEANGRNTFVFAITMGNHSPWQSDGILPGVEMPQAEAFAGFLEGLRRTDEAVGQMADIMRREWRNGLMGVFGDHQPSFPQLCRHAGFTDRRTDYFFYRPGQARGPSCDIAAYQLPGLLLQDAADYASVRARLTVASGD